MSVHEKAQRIVASGAIEHAGEADVFTVEGDTDTYTVVVWDGGACCSCEHGKYNGQAASCAHALAAGELAE